MIISKRVVVICALALVLTLLGCQATAQPTETLETASSPLESPLRDPAADLTSPTPSEPDQDKATIFGRVIDNDTEDPLIGVAVRLAEVHREGEEGAFVLDDAVSPADLTDDSGWFTIENVEAREYVIVVGDVNFAYQIITESSGDAKVWELPAGVVTDAGTLYVSLY